MAVTPNDIYDKTFSDARRSKEGYDMDEVDEYLDTLAEEIRALIKERDGLQSKNDQLSTQLSTTQADLTEAEKSTAGALDKSLSNASSESTDSATNVLTMAQKLHDEHVNAGLLQRDKIITEAQIEANSLLNDAEDKRRTVLGDLENQKGSLERRVDQLRTFERDYRSKLKTYIETQLTELDTRDSVATADVKPSAASAASATMASKATPSVTKQS